MISGINHIKEIINIYKSERQKMWNALQTVSPILHSHQPKAHLLTIHEPSTHNQHSDIILLSYLIHLLENTPNAHVLFFGIRQNYAHFLSISKKLGKPLEQFLKKNENFCYHECFMHQYCEQLPLGDTSPTGYIAPPKTIKQLKKFEEIPQIIAKQAVPNTYVFVDCLAFIEHKPEICYEIYQNCVLNECAQVIMGGCVENSPISKMISSYGQIKINIENDVGGYGRMTVISGSNEASYLWRWIAGKMEVERSIRV